MNMVKPLFLSIFLLIIFAFPFPVSAQTPVQNDDTTLKPQVRAVRTKDKIKIDGVLDEVAWENAKVISDFRQQEPNEGSDATEKTEIRILFDDKNIYFAIRAFDSEPTRINARELVRDSSFANDDKVEILLDTYHDKRNGFRFTVNPLGTQQDALITDEREVNTQWDAPWTSAGKKDEKGYVVEIAIPLTTLRFKEGLDTWGFNVARIIRRKNEEVLWTSWLRSFGLERVSQAGELKGVGEIRRSRLKQIKPYLSGEWQQGIPLVGQTGYDAGIRGTAGIEVAKIGITPSLTAEFTVNPDFGQADVDNQVVNLTRFSIFFPEKRDFFLENAGIFSFGRERTNQIFFSRRIGLTASGAPVPIDYGVKVTGKINRFNVGLLQVQTRELGNPATSAGIPRQHFTVFRTKADILKRSSIGAVLTNRQGGKTSAYNRGAGFDTQLKLTDYLQLSGFVMGTASPNRRSDFLSWRVTASYEDNLYRFVLINEKIGRNFNPELGFVSRRGVTQYFSQAAYKWRPKNFLQIRQVEFEGQLEYYADKNGKLSTRQNEITIDTEFKNSSTLFFRPFEDVTDVLKEPFEIRQGVIIPMGSYHFNRPRISFNTNASKPLVLNTRIQWGDFYSGTRTETSAGFTLRPNPHLFFEINDSFNKIDLPQGSFTTNLFGGRVNVNFSRKLLTSAFVQLNSSARLSSLNMRLRYIYRPNSSLFIIYNQSTGKGLERPNYSFQIKLTYDLTF